MHCKSSRSSTICALISAYTTAFFLKLQGHSEHAWLSYTQNFDVQPKLFACGIFQLSADSFDQTNIWLNRL